MKFREPEPIRPFDEHGIGPRDIEAVLYDGRADQNVSLSADENTQSFLHLRFCHLTVADHHAGFRCQLSDVSCDAFNCLYSVM